MAEAGPVAVLSAVLSRISGGNASMSIKPLSLMASAKRKHVAQLPDVAVPRMASQQCQRRWRQLRAHIEAGAPHR
ncbi:hypothetical protein ACTMU2_16015 [Cupriavidus basilensis]